MEGGQWNAVHDKKEVISSRIIRSLTGMFISKNDACIHPDSTVHQASKRSCLYTQCSVADGN